MGWFAHLETSRPYTACYVGIVGLAGAALADAAADPKRLACAWAIPTLGWLAGLYGGDYFDRHLDAQAKPHRPIPSGRMSPRTALACFLGFAALGAALSILVNWRTVLLVAAAMACGVAYSTVFKARGLAGNLIRGSITGFAFLYGTMMTADWPPLRVAPLALIFVAHDAASNLVGALRDIAGDRAAGYLTYPVQVGALAAQRTAVALLVIAYGLALAAPAVTGHPVTIAYTALLVIACAAAFSAVAPLFGRPEDTLRPAAYRAHTVLVFARILVAGALFVWALPRPVSWIVVAAALAATWTSQRLLRARHEFDSPRTPITAAEVLDYVDTQLARLPEMSGLAGWSRVIDIVLSDPDLHIRLVADGGRLRRSDPGDRAPALTTLTITTTGDVFRDIFLLGTSNPRRAYLTRRLGLAASPSDMVRINQLFNNFRRANDSPAPRPSARAVPNESAAPPQLPHTVVVSDTTLRDGEQMPGVVFTPAEKLTIADHLIRLGIPLIEAGYPAVSEQEAEAVRAVVAHVEATASDRALVQAIARPLDRDVDAALASGAHSIAIFIGTSPIHLAAKLGLTLDQVCTRVDHAVRRAKRAGRQVVFAAEDATRTEPDQLLRVFDAAAQAGVDTLGIADTVGIANPHSMAALVSAVAADCALPIAVHCHNDLGLATANSLAGVAAGASGVQCSVLGIGERAGNAPLEQVALALFASLGVDPGLDLTGLLPLADYVSGLVNAATAPYQPVVGGNAFTHESGLHLDGLTQDPRTYEPYDPAVVGRTRRIVLGKHSGTSAVRAVAEALGIELDDPAARAILAEIKQASQTKRLQPPPTAEEWVTRLAAKPAKVGR
ncbi:UbiA family prenyltransferase [Nocardia transvalensis]|uniref:UbiA family prenyltransferase n=1 Tax=Nocardia transvalensis TaxID=37333 RepID=UPI001894ED26|nr:UbiA family prenyltransferase [Nocardia transvalensis]MBF6329431.1 UbiA family prenyltransferase [Nocardia transvalensis]